jgi:hypothetical protein
MILINITMAILGGFFIFFGIISCRGTDYELECIKCPVIWLQLIGAFLIILGVITI